jgi:hypothetical protein
MEPVRINTTETLVVRTDVPVDKVGPGLICATWGMLRMVSEARTVIVVDTTGRARVIKANRGPKSVAIVNRISR